MTLLHTPYDGSSPLFRIGVRPLDPADWIEVDERLVDYLDEKARVAAASPDAVFAAEPGTADAQAEVLALLADHLPRRFPAIYRHHGDSIEIVPAGRTLRLDAPGMPPLAVAAALVQEDLVLMRRGDAGWRLAAAALSFPSSWRLGDKLGRPMAEVHGPVPGFGAGSRSNEVIGRMFDHLRPEQPVIRWNWSLYGDDRLRHAEPAETGGRFGPSGDRIFLRVERQTLRRLPASGDIVFTIRIHVDPLAALGKRPDAARLAAGLATSLAGLSAEEAAYKGLAADLPQVLATLRRLAEASIR